MRQVDNALFLDAAESFNAALSITAGRSGKHLGLLNERLELPCLDLSLTGDQRILRILINGELPAERILYVEDVEGSPIQEAFVRRRFSIFNGLRSALLKKVQHQPADDDGKYDHHQELGSEDTRLVLTWVVLTRILGE